MTLSRRWLVLASLTLAACGSPGPGNGGGGAGKISSYDLLVVDSSGNLAGVMADGTKMTVLKKKGAFDSSDAFQQLAISPDGKRLAYRASCGGTSFLREMGPDLGAPKDLTPSCGTKSASWPAFSPDGTEIAFIACFWSSAEKGCYLHLMKSDGTGEHRVTPLDPGGADPSEGSPVFSADGTHIVFVGNRSGCMEVFSIGVDGSGMTALEPASCPSSVVPFTVALDGPHGVLYEVLSQSGGLQNIYAAAYPNGSPTQVTTEAQHGDQRPAVSPDGSLIAYDQDSGSFGFGTLEVRNLASGKVTSISGTGYYGYDQYPVFVPKP